MFSIKTREETNKETDMEPSKWRIQYREEGWRSPKLGHQEEQETEVLPDVNEYKKKRVILPAESLGVN